MADLVAEYFSRDLSRGEEAALELLFENSPEDAERFAELSLAEYRSMGLPEPRFRPRWIRMKRPWKWTLALLLSGAGAWAFMPYSKISRPDLALPGEIFTLEKARPKRARPVMKAAEPLALAALETPRLSLAHSAPETVKRGSLLGVLVRQAETGPARVTVKDSQGREVLELFKGSLPAGERRFEWNGRLKDGSAADPGTYSIEVKRGDSVQVKTLTLKPARP